MGCDVHVHVEVKIQGQWHHYNHPDVDRSYGLFEKMAGVRGEGSEAIAAPRGIPTDATFMTLYDYKRWGQDAHTPSWLNAEEILVLSKWYETAWKEYDPKGYHPFEFEFGFIFGNGWELGDRRDGVEDVRIVFWFDN